MKLIYCPKCKDLVKLPHSTFQKACECGLSSGRYNGDHSAEISGYAIPIGIDDQSFDEAIDCRLDRSLGRPFIAFVLPKEHGAITEIDEFFIVEDQVGE